MKSAPNGLKNMTILIDSNVALDILLNRQPWYEKAALIFSLTRRGVVKSYVSASAITDIFYVARKDLGKSAARESIKRLVQVFYPATVTDDHIVTRNTQDFSSSHIPAVTPEQFMQIIVDNL
jgi:predicted nucleic acid-binding protein